MLFSINEQLSFLVELTICAVDSFRAMIIFKIHLIYKHCSGHRRTVYIGDVIRYKII